MKYKDGKKPDQSEQPDLNLMLLLAELSVESVNRLGATLKAKTCFPNTTSVSTNTNIYSTSIPHSIGVHTDTDTDIDARAHTHAHTHNTQIHIHMCT